jgi:MFS family permease
MLLLPWLAQPGWLYLVPALFGLGMGLASPALTAWMLRQSPVERRAVSVNTFTLLTEGSGFFSSWLVGAFLQSGSLGGFAGLSALLALGLGAFVAIEKHDRERKPYDRYAVPIE